MGANEAHPCLPTTTSSSRARAAYSAARGNRQADEWTHLDAWGHAIEKVTAGERPASANEAFAIVSVLDMNADGAPEIVVHARSADTYDDDVYTLEPDGRVQLVVSRSGGYA
ncbi:hypothetical protein AKJ09_04147 [Labilithrix luteola]|uniref:VCBS repeat-containing protein n=2 Tax=Labilithrix luteola TaxID=1391654 RepID=A0A0K1PVC2_9BACT|nr:hypothetical protein AKJ09_04147 [Labilithrix luteola]